MKTTMVVKGIFTVALMIGVLFTVIALAAESTFTGMIDESDEGIYILSANDGEEYVLIGGELASMVGKTVKVTGTLVENSEFKTITLMSIEEVEK
jgi:TRAP-type uncharacterized transport system substrate-binding protein